MKKTVSILAMLLVVISAMAQTSLQGVVTSADGGQPIEDVKVTLAGQNISTTTNQKGEFTLTYL